MEFETVAFDGLVGSTDTTAFASLSPSDPEPKLKLYGSEFLKQDRSSCASEDDLRSLKMMKTDDFSASKTMLFQHRSPLLRSNNGGSNFFCDGEQQEQMLSFSSPKSEAQFLSEKSSQSMALPYYHALSSAAYSRNTGYGYGGLNGSMHGMRGPFTPSQWMELEHQALIYKHITANVPIPPNLLIPIRKALQSAGFSGYTGGSLRPNSLGWGSFHLGYSGSNDPEPGRCRRTDGKKWRCSRDAVADQKYCERHINRGRHRSRKPVEGQPGHSVTGNTTATAATAPRLIPATTSASVVVSNGGYPINTLTIAQQHLQPGVSNPACASSQINRAFLNKENMGETMRDSPGLSMLSPTINLKPKENQLAVPKEQITYEESSQTDFGLFSSNFLINPTQKSSASINNPEKESQHPLRHFIDLQPNNTQLTISIPMATSDYISSSSSLSSQKPTVSPLRLSRELDPVQMGLGVGESNQRHGNWIPISWENSMGGPLGEVLHKSNNNSSNNNNSEEDCRDLVGLNLMTEAWDGSPQIGSTGSSPTGVLQKTLFGSLSNSSAGSSPRAETNKTLEGVSLCNDLLGSTIKDSSL